MRRLILSAALLAITHVVWAQTPQVRIQDAISATRAAATEEQKTNPGWKDFAADLTGALDRAEAAAKSGRLFLSVEELKQAKAVLSANHSAARAAKEGMEGFEKAWEQSQ